MMRRTIRAWVPTAFLATIAFAAPAAAHLLITEVGYDPVDETAPTAEFVEILNPDPVGVPLGNVWLAGDEDAYPYLVNGPVASITLNNFIYRFPALTLEPNAVAVVCQDSDAFLAEHFVGGLDAFLDRPGTQILFEVTQDGPGDGVPDLIPYGSNPSGTLSMANNGECVGLVTWDGASDRVADLDWVCWLTTTFIPNKDVDYPLGIDGPDANTDPSWFVEDLANGAPAPDAAQGFSIHRTSLAEPGEMSTGGNGPNGHDETSENWSSWVVADESPGVSGLSTVGVPVPSPASHGLALAPAPNPSRADVRIAYTLPRAGHVRITVHDLAGRTVMVLADRFEDAGSRAVRWSGTDGSGAPAPIGLYVVRLVSGDATIARSLIRIR